MSTSSHQDSPKVPAAAIEAARKATGYVPAMLEVALSAARPHMLSALLSNEAIEALARADYMASRFESEEGKRQPEGGDEEDWPEAKTHELKCWAPYFGEVLSGRKSFEVRRDDRHFKEGDLLKLRETDPHTGAYTGRECKRRITYKFGFPTVNEAFGLREDVVVLALVPATSQDSSGPTIKDVEALFEEAQREANREEDRANKAEAERYRWMARCGEAEEALERAEVALEDLAEEFEREALKCSPRVRDAYRTAASLAREKAAKLKGPCGRCGDTGKIADPDPRLATCGVIPCPDCGEGEA